MKVWCVPANDQVMGHPGSESAAELALMLAPPVLPLQPPLPFWPSFVLESP